MSKEGLIPETLSKALGYSGSEKIARLTRKPKEGESEKLPSFTILADISNMFENLNIRWLLTGNGEPYIIIEGGKHIDYVKEENKIEFLKELLDEKTKEALELKKQLDQIMDGNNKNKHRYG